MRDPTAGAGLVIVQGRQHPFGLEGVWRSDALPRPGIVVDVEFDDAGRVVAMMAVPEARLVKEQAEAAIAFAGSKGASAFARLGWRQLAAVTLLVAGLWSAGRFSVGAVLCLAGPFLVCVWSDRRAHLAAALPLAFALAAVLPIFGGAHPPSAPALDAGACVALLAGLYLALAGVKRFFVATARDATSIYEHE